MKKIGKSHIFAFVLGAILFSGITGVAAYTVLASDISFTPSDTTWKTEDGEDITNVQDAIDSLYIKGDKKMPDSIRLLLRGDSYSNSYNTTALISIDGTIKNTYKYFKIDTLTKNTYVSSCTINYWDSSQGKAFQYETNKEYLTASTNTSTFLNVKSKSNGQQAVCETYITFYNK